MNKTLTINDIDESVKSKIYDQDYGKKNVIDGVKIVDLVKHISEEGDFSEITRISQEGTMDKFPDFKIAQINRTKLFPGTVKAWHLHFEQDEVWYLVPSGHLVVGLWDLRKNSKTRGQSMRVVLGGGLSKLLYVPRGIAHGSLNLAEKPAELFYFVNKQFNINNPDEKRISWDALGSNFWEPQRD